MKQQSIGIVLCALLLTTFGHELLQRQHEAHSARLGHSAHARSHARSHIAARSDTKKKDCSIICEPIVCTGNLTFGFNGSLIGTANITAGIVKLTDIEAKLIALFNASLSTVTIINLETETGVVSKYNRTVDLVEFLAINISLTALWEQGGQWFDKKNITEEVSIQIVEFLILISGGELKVEVKEALSFLITITLRIVAAISIIAPVFEIFVGNLTITYRQIIELTEGLAQALSSVTGGIAAIAAKKVKFTLSALVALGSAVAVTVFIIATLVEAGVECHKIQNSTDFLILVAVVSGNSTVGINGVFTLLGALAAFIVGKITILAVITVLIEFLVDNPNRGKLKALLNETVHEISKKLQSSNISSNAEIKVVNDALVQIGSGCLIVDGINLSEILSCILTTNVVLQVIIAVLIALKVRIAIEIAIAYLIVALIVLLAKGSFEIVEFIIGVRIEIIKDIIGALVKAFVEARGNLYKVICEIKALNTIREEIDKSLVAAGLKLTLEGILSAPGIIKVIIEGLGSFGYHIQIGGGISIG